MDTPEVTQHPAASGGTFTIERDGKQLATLNYSQAGNIVIINHTEVDPALRGTGAGGRLVEAVVQLGARRSPAHRAAVPVRRNRCSTRSPITTTS